MHSVPSRQGIGCDWGQICPENSPKVFPRYLNMQNFILLTLSWVAVTHIPFIRIARYGLWMTATAVKVNNTSIAVWARADIHWLEETRGAKRSLSARKRIFGRTWYRPWKVFVWFHVRVCYVTRSTLTPLHSLNSSISALF